MELQVGMKVIFTGDYKALDKNTIGVLSSMHNDYGVIVYPQNAAYEDDGKGGWKPIKGAGNKIYAHSVKLSEVKLA